MNRPREVVIEVYPGVQVRITAQLEIRPPPWMRAGRRKVKRRGRPPKK